jgi:N-acetylglucosamine-6-phosphate deacetylase
MTERVFLSGSSLVLADRIESGRTLVMESGRITDFAVGPRDIGPSETRVHLPGCFVLPGFVDVHVHGIGGHDVMDSATAVDRVAALLPRHGVTAFCPTSIACDPPALESFLASVAAARQAQAAGSARVLGAHLESNFINAAFAGAQPVECIRSALSSVAGQGDSASFTGADILNVVERHRADVQILTLAPEIDGALALVERLVAMGIRVSLGHSGATFDQGQAAIAAGAKHATHLFNRMPPLTHREPGLAGAILASNDVVAELICDGHHVHPAVLRMAIAAKGLPRIIAVTDATAGAGLPRGSRAVLGGRAITVRDVAELDDGTTAGSVATMDRVFACLVGQCGLDIRDAAEICSTTPARELGLVGFGVISPGSWADLTVLDQRLAPLQTWIGGKLAWSGTSVQPEPSPSS